MKVSVIGCGNLGAVHAACMAQLGHHVVGIDVDERKVAALRVGTAPFYEPGLPELLAEVSATGRLTLSSDMADAAGADVHFICVGTPQAHGEFRADLTYVDAATRHHTPDPVWCLPRGQLPGTSRVSLREVSTRRVSAGD